MVFSSDYLSECEKERLHSAICHVLAHTGVCFRDKQAVAVFKKHGARTDGEMVYIDERLLMSSLKNAPRSFKVCGRTPDRDFVVGGGAPAFAPASGPVFVADSNGRRPAAKQDFINILKLIETSDLIHFVNYIAVEPQDIPEEKRKLYQIAKALAMTTKPLVGMAMGSLMSDKALSLVSQFYGGLEQYRMIGVINPISPLLYDAAMIEHIAAYARHKQPLMVCPCSLPGATSPVTIAGTILLDCAQTLAGIVLSQLLCPGLPVLFGSTSVSCDMRFLSPAIGSPETGMVSAATVSMAHYYCLPCRTGGALTDAKAVDTQVGIEAAMTLLPALSAGTDFVMHAAGLMDSFNSVSLEKFIIDEDLLAFCQRLVKGFQIDEDTLSLALIDKVGAAGQYLEENHTLERYAHELHMPRLLSKEGYNKWEREGRLSLAERAAKEVATRTAGYTMPQLEPERKKILRAYNVY